MGSSRVLKAVPVMVLAFASPVFSQDTGRPNTSKPEEPRPAIAQPAATNRPVIVQPGAPGQPTRILPENTTATPPPISKKDIEFMEGMIVHHSQAVEMTELIEDRTEDPDIRLIGAKIMQSQSDEMEFMKRWLKSVGRESVGQWGSGAVGQGTMSGQHSMSGHEGTQKKSEMSGHEGMQMRPGTSGHEGMPGMLSPQQMTALKRASGKEFDRLFLLGMIQHHEGALVMVRDLFDTAGAGQNAELFGFATDVDSGQRAEIATMKNLLQRKFPDGGK